MNDAAAPPALDAPPRGGFMGAVGLLVATGVACALLVRARPITGLLASLAGVLAWLLLAAIVAAVRRRPRALLVPVALLAGLLGYVASGHLARRMLFPGNPLPLEAGAPGRVDYATDDGVELRGLLLRGQGAGRRPAIVFFHGNGDSAARVRDAAGLFAARGLDTFVAEYRGFGGCAGAPTEAGLLRDARAAVREASARTGVAAGELLLVGQSLGTGLAAAMAAEGHGRAVVLISPYTSILDLAGRLVPPPLAWLAVRDPFDSRARLLAARQPVVVLHGDADRVIPHDHGAALAQACAPRGRLVTLAGCGHNDVFRREGRRIVDETAALAERP